MWYTIVITCCSITKTFVPNGHLNSFYTTQIETF